MKMNMAQILLDAGADPTAQNDEDETPAALAEKRGHAPMVALLEQRNQARTAGGGRGLTPGAGSRPPLWASGAWSRTHKLVGEGRPGRRRWRYLC